MVKCKHNNRFNIYSHGYLSSRVAGVDDHEGPGVAGLSGLREGALQLGDVQAPVGLLVEVVPHLVDVKLGQGCGVQGVLGDRNQNG